MLYLSMPHSFWEMLNPEPQYAIDVGETEDAVSISLEMPGFEKGKISILRENGILSVSAEKAVKTKEGKDVRSFNRRFAMPPCVDLEQIDATYEDGILTLTAKKKDALKPRKIDIR